MRPIASYNADKSINFAAGRRIFSIGGVSAAQCFDNPGASVNNGARLQGIAAALTDHDTPAPGQGDAQPSRGDASGRAASPPRPAGGETGGPKGLEPTRYGDWERGGRCVDF